MSAKLQTNTHTKHLNDVPDHYIHPYHDYIKNLRKKYGRIEGLLNTLQKAAQEFFDCGVWWQKKDFTDDDRPYIESVMVQYKVPIEEFFWVSELFIILKEEYGNDALEHERERRGRRREHSISLEEPSYSIEASGESGGDDGEQKSLPKKNV